MKNGHTQPHETGVQVILTEGDVEIANLYVESEEQAEAILASWRDGTYRLLTETW